MFDKEGFKRNFKKPVPNQLQFVFKKFRSDEF